MITPTFIVVVLLGIALPIITVCILRWIVSDDPRCEAYMKQIIEELENGPTV